ncbi:MAG TPA: LCP family protein, partial [Candidatus Limnocylindria bacterium]|nr:LCP family protein [Candidatus Limnocylindria bacterium]
GAATAMGTSSSWPITSRSSAAYCVDPYPDGRPATLHRFNETCVSHDPRPYEDVPYDRELIRSGGVSQGRRRGEEPRVRRRDDDRYRDYRPRPRRRRGSTAGRVFKIALTAVVVVITLVIVRAAFFNASVSSAFFPSTALLGPLNGSDRVNVLLVGYGGPNHGGPFLADSIQIMSIDPATDITTTIPIPRDLWIEGVAGYDRNSKVNEVFSVGNANGGLDEAGALLGDILTQVTGLEIHHVISIDFDGFREMVDAVGGVTIDNPTAFSYTMSPEQHAAGDWSDGSFAAGEIHMNGEEALAYARARYTSVPSEGNDFARSVRQARIMGALREQLGDGGIGSIIPGLRLMDAMEGRVRTDLSAIDLYLLSSHLQSDRRVELAEGPVLTASTSSGGAYILLPTGWTGPGDYAGIRSYLASQLSTDAS